MGELIARHDPERRFYFRSAPWLTRADFRFIWLPEVHDKYNERCYFFLISAPDRSPELRLAEQLSEIMRAADVESYSLYSLHGTYDALIRVWASAAAILRLTPALQAIALDDLLTFEVSGVEYLFSVIPAVQARKTISKFDQIISAVTLVESSDGWPSSDALSENGFLPPQVKALDDLGLIIRVPNGKFPDGQGLKFYSYIERRGALRAQTQGSEELRGLREAMHAGSIQVGSIYQLNNNKGYFIKGLVANFDALADALEYVYDFCLDRGFRIQTFPIPNLDKAIECELIDSSVRDDSWQSEAIVESLSAVVPGARTYLGALQGENRPKFMAFLRQNSDVLRDAESIEDLGALLVAIAIGEPRAISKSLTFVLEIEELLRQAAWLLIQKEVGQDARRLLLLSSRRTDLSLQSLILDDDESSEILTPLDRLSLAQIRVLLGVIASEHAQFRDAIVELLGTEWKAKIDSVRELRNEIAHGRFRFVVDKQGSALTSYLDAVRFRFALDNYVGRAINQGSVAE